MYTCLRKSSKNSLNVDDTLIAPFLHKIIPSKETNMRTSYLEGSQPGVSYFEYAQLCSDLNKMADTSRQRRGQYAKICQADRQRIISAFEDPTKNYMEVALLLGVKRTTTQSIIRSFLEVRKVAS